MSSAELYTVAPERPAGEAVDGLEERAPLQVELRVVDEFHGLGVFGQPLVKGVPQLFSPGQHRRL